MKTTLLVRKGKILKAIDEFNSSFSDELECFKIKVISCSKPIQDTAEITVEFYRENDLFWLGAYYRTA